MDTAIAEKYATSRLKVLLPEFTWEPVTIHGGKYGGARGEIWLESPCTCRMMACKQRTRKMPFGFWIAWVDGQWDSDWVEPEGTLEALVPKIQQAIAEEALRAIDGWLGQGHVDNLELNPDTRFGLQDGSAKQTPEAIRAMVESKYGFALVRDDADDDNPDDPYDIENFL